MSYGKAVTNYERLFQEQMKNPDFAKAYYDTRVDRIMQNMLDTLKEKISSNESRENLLQMIDAMQQQLHRTAA